MLGVGGGKPGVAARGRKAVLAKKSHFHAHAEPWVWVSVWRASHSWLSSQEGLPWDGLVEARV